MQLDYTVRRRCIEMLFVENRTLRLKGLSNWSISTLIFEYCFGVYNFAGLKV